MTKYCGYEIGKEISVEDVGRLHDFLNANFTKQELIELNDEQLRAIAKSNKKEWKYDSDKRSKNQINDVM